MRTCGFWLKNMRPLSHFVARDTQKVDLSLVKPRNMNVLVVNRGRAQNSEGGRKLTVALP
jgi:hypothetical protein